MGICLMICVVKEAANSCFPPVNLFTFSGGRAVGQWQWVGGKVGLKLK